jgi:nucleoside-diphosphate-sugar epimerase
MACHVLIVGCGDVGQRIAARHLAAGDAVTGLVRSAASAQTLTARGIMPLQADLDADWLMPLADAVYWCAPPPAGGVTDPRIERALAQWPVPLGGRPGRLLYVSTTGVYGDCQGRWIREAEPLKPQTARGFRRLAAELAVHTWAASSGGHAVVLRVPGIYGPGRLPVERLKGGAPVLALAESPWSNRIHADDLADAAVLALARGQRRATYHVSDGQPTSISDYLLRTAAALGLPPPAQVTMAEARAGFSATLLSYLDESKRLDCTALRALAWQPRYPTLAQGLAACR